ncbi:EthD family reductase [Paraglaciecola sp.]|uniref:EthD family reductase n=1 Tax=Paraglaciecola sp. TaxID=1920173 RepID=UPI00273EB7C3|nr:EthD family reductase [Paraglaciecola sp.]MDP5032985.1 EthD family reductase [Paraglaciecola sp.]
MTKASLRVLYPHPTDAEKFDQDYQQHLALFHEKTKIPKDKPPYTVSKFHATPLGNAAYYQMFSLPFDSMEALQQTMMSAEMQSVAADAVKISTGGQPVVLIASDQ